MNMEIIFTISTGRYESSLLNKFYYWLKVISAVTTPDLILSQLAILHSSFVVTNITSGNLFEVSGFYLAN